MDKVKIVKKAVTFVVGVGATSIVKGIAKNNAEMEHLYQKVEVNTASYVLGAMLAEVAKKYTDPKIDAVVNWFEKSKWVQKESNSQSEPTP